MSYEVNEIVKAVFSSKDFIPGIKVWIKNKFNPVDFVDTVWFSMAEAVELGMIPRHKPKNEKIDNRYLEKHVKGSFLKFVYLTKSAKH